MAKNIEYGDWVYLKSNPEMIYKVYKLHSQIEIELISIKKEKALVLKNDLILITDVIKIQELESAWEATLS